MFVSTSNQQIWDSLVGLNLCTDRDFRRCRRRVRKLARGLPAFDFVWIDALVQCGALTPFQAQHLAEGPPEHLCVGPCILLSRLGRGENHETYLARTRGGEDGVVLKRIRIPADSRAFHLSRLRALADALREPSSPFVVAPHDVLEENGAILAISRFVGGPDCEALLVRRGRFPADVVGEIARQLAAGLAALEARRCLHGEIRLRNVRLGRTGRAVLVDAGLATALTNGLAIRADVAPDRYDGVAPERIGTGNPLTTETELYAFGCLLWQMLAGRAPFPTNDPLGKLAAHQSRDVPDVRDLAPDTPAPLAEAIRAFTQRDPQKRPATFAEVAARFGPPARTSERRLQRFHCQFDTAAPREAAPAVPRSRFPMAAILLLIFVFSGAVLTLLDRGATAHLLFVGSGRRGSPETVTASTVNDSQPHKRGEGNRGEPLPPQPLPVPDASGVIVLSSGRYEAESISFVGDLTIRGAGQSPPVLVIGDRPFQVNCRKLSIEHVVVERQSDRTRKGIRTAAKGVTGASMSVRCQELIVLGSGFVTRRSETTGEINGRGVPGEAGEQPMPAIGWTPLLADDAERGKIRLSNCVFYQNDAVDKRGDFLSPGAALALEGVPGRIEVENCLVVGGSFLRLRQWPATDVVISAQHLTLRRAVGFCCVQNARARGPRGRLRMAVDDCVFDLALPAASLVQLVSRMPPSGRDCPMAIMGSDCVIRPGVPIVMWFKSGERDAVPIELNNVAIEGVTVGDFRFVGPPQTSCSNSVVDRDSLQVPRRSDDPPGISAEPLPAIPGSIAAAVDSAPRSERR